MKEKGVKEGDRKKGSGEREGRRRREKRGKGKEGEIEERGKDKGKWGGEREELEQEGVRENGLERHRKGMRLGKRR